MKFFDAHHASSEEACYVLEEDGVRRGVQQYSLCAC